jgi:ABC-2 type transport system ATP-binding protein
MIEIQNVHKSYGDTSVLKDVSFSVDKGEIVGFLGQNGVGKTTLMRIIMGYLPPTRGRVLVDGIDVLKKPVDIRSKIGYLPEGNPLYFEMKVFEYLHFMARAKGEKNIKSKIAEVVQKTMLEEKYTALISDLSKGYKQRVGLAASLLGDPEILILDEPSSGLDPNQAIAMRDLIREVGKTKTVIFSSHIMQEVEAVCDRIVVLHDKEIVKDMHLHDSHEQKLSHIEVVAEGDVAALLSGIESVEKLQKKGDVYIVGSFNPRNTQREIFKQCAKSNIILLEMKVVHESLEDMFTMLTR